MADNYTITGQRQTMRLTPNGSFLPVWEVSYSTPSGATGMVDIPASQYTATKVHEVIDALAQENEKVANL